MQRSHDTWRLSAVVIRHFFFQKRAEIEDGMANLSLSGAHGIANPGKQYLNRCKLSLSSCWYFFLQDCKPKNNNEKVSMIFTILRLS